MERIDRLKLEIEEYSRAVEMLSGDPETFQNVLLTLGLKRIELERELKTCLGIENAVLIAQMSRDKQKPVDSLKEAIEEARAARIKREAARMERYERK